MQIAFWLREARDVELIANLAARFPEQLLEAANTRMLLLLAHDFSRLSRALKEEEEAEREADRVYWQPLRQELEQLRHSR